MKKNPNFLLTFLSCVIFTSIFGGVVKVSAQTQTDRELADFIKSRTNRTLNGLVKKRNAKGEMSVDLQGRFQNLMLSKLDYSGNPIAGCVDDLEQANVFFGKNLETGQLLFGFPNPVDEINQQAALHGMSAEEFTFYQNLINQSLEKIALSPNSANITIINNDGAGEGFNDPTAATPEGGNNGTTLGAQRLNLFNAAAAIWGSYLDSSVTIQVKSQFDPLTCSSNSAVLGSAGAATIHANFANAILSNTWYPQALANKQSLGDRSANPDINATFNSTVNGNAGCLSGARFYLGLDSAKPSGTVNLLVVLLHEMGHGLGFQSFANTSTGAYQQGLPDVFTTNMFDRTTQKFWNSMTDAERMASAFNTNNVLWTGPNVKIASGNLTGGRDTSNGFLQLYTPDPVSSGSTVSHWSTAATPNLLMEPFITSTLTLDLDVTPHQLRDIGWFRDTNLDGTPDAILNVTPSGGTATGGSQLNVTWNNSGGFNKNVSIELSVDNGSTYPTKLATNIANTGSYTVTVRIRRQHRRKSVCANLIMLLRQANPV